MMGAVNLLDALENTVTASRGGFINASALAQAHRNPDQLRYRDRCRLPNPPAMTRQPHNNEIRGEDAVMQFTVKGWNNGWRTWFALNANDLAWTALIVGGVFFTALFIHR
jgi:hypothetical protein